MALRYTVSGYHPAVSPLPQPLDGPCLSTGRGTPRTSVLSYCCHNRCLQLGRYMQRAGSLGALDRAVGQARVSPHGQYCGCLVHQPAGRYTITHMSQLVRHLLLWSHTQFKSLRAVHIPGKLNRVSDALSRQLLFPGEW